MIAVRRWLAERLLDVLVESPIQRGKYRLAQLGALLLDGIPIHSRYGPYLHTRFADSTFWLAARYGNDEMMALLSDLSSADGFIDIGANIGLTTCFAQTRCAAVLSLEASSREFAELQRNCALLTAPPPVVLLAAAADRSGFLPFRIGHISHSGGNSLGAVHSTAEQQQLVQAVRIDDLLNDDALSEWPAMQLAWDRHQLVVKIDVEGFEAAVLGGMSLLLSERRCRKVIVEINDQRAAGIGMAFDVDAYMQSLGYSPSVDPAGRLHFDQCFIPRR